LADRFIFVVNHENFLIRDDYLVRANRRERIRHLGSSQTFCVSRDREFHELLFAHSCEFRTPITRNSFVMRLRIVEIPKSVRFLGEKCFCQYSFLTKVVFESPATVQRIECEHSHRASVLRPSQFLLQFPLWVILYLRDALN
jgi:hypothetical protein